VQLGAHAVVVSNHGGRQLDQGRAAIAALPEVVDGVGGRADVILDGGVRRGTDIAKAMALGARAVMIGRPYLYGLAAGGEAGVARALAMLDNELRTTMALLGTPTLADLGPAAVTRVR
jgi:isopentenyl diphosphate isomerase/L-lactate dehydrogenase-like FMN-dependent dehydrogenase